MALQKEKLDWVLVPMGILIMLFYHLFLLRRYLLQPHTTVMGFENQDKKIWVDRVMQADKLNLSSALTVLTSNITAATYLATISLTLCSLIGAWIANTNTNTLFTSAMIYGDTGSTIMSVKYISLLICFLLAFTFFLQAVRCFIHANYLISTPASDLPEYAKYVEDAVIRAGEFWSLGLRSLYFALNLLLWFFGPIPMFSSSVIMVVVLYFLDRNTSQRSIRSNKPKVKSELENV